MRQDFWLFLGYLLGMGTVSETEECSHGAVELAVSFNGPMRVAVEGKALECSLLALGPHVPHTIDGSLGWQFFGYLHPDSRLAQLIMEKIGKSGRPWLCGSADFSRGEPIIPSLDNEFSAYSIRELWEFLLSHLLGIKSYSLGWSQELTRIVKLVESMPWDRLSISSLAGSLETTGYELEQHFFQLAGIPLSHFLFNRRLVRTAELIGKGRNLDRALSEAGLSGKASITEYIRSLYGLDMENLLTEKPCIRFFSAADYEQLSGHAL